MAHGEILTGVFLSFLAKLSEIDRVWLAVGCSVAIDDKIPEIATGEDADKWFRGYLEAARRPEQHFGRLIHLIAILDFQLSPFALTRMEIRADGMTQSDNDAVAAAGRHMLHETIPRLRDTVSAWSDVRTHELDQASLWVHRDEAKRLEWEEIGKHFGWDEK